MSASRTAPRATTAAQRGATLPKSGFKMTSPVKHKASQPEGRDPATLGAERTAKALPPKGKLHRFENEAEATLPNKRGDLAKARKMAKDHAESPSGKLKSLEGYVAGLSLWQQSLAHDFVDLVQREAPEAKVSVKEGHPTWSHHGPFATLESQPEYLSFGFHRGGQMEDPEGLFQEGEQLKTIKLMDGERLPQGFAGFVSQALVLNLVHGKPAA